jgi:hypothetical protein
MRLIVLLTCMFLTAAVNVGQALAPNAACGANPAPYSVEFTPGSYKLPRSVYSQWIEKSAAAVTQYYGRFPVPHLVVRVLSTAGDDVGYSSADNEDGTPVIELRVGRDITASDLLRSWECTHEMVHLAFPLVDDDDKFVAEGMATYIEPIARLQIHDLSRTKVWGDLYKNFPRGLSEHPQGFRNARTFSSIYWGGALFCLLADIEFRTKTNNKIGLQQALSAVPQHGGTITSDYSAADALRVADSAAGVAVLIPLYKRFHDEPIEIDLASLWKKLGVSKVDDRIIFDESAPLASIRRAIEKG